MNQRGNMLMAAIVGVGISGIVMAALTTMITNAQRDTLALSQKLEILQLEQAMAGTLAYTDICSCNFDPNKNTTQPRQSLAFDSANTANARINLNNLYGSCASGTPSQPIATSGQPLPGSTSGLAVTGVALNNLVSAGAGGVFTADLTVNLDNNRLVVPRRPPAIKISLVADVTTNPAQATIINCTSGDASTIDTAIDRKLAAMGSCPTGQVLLGYQADGSLNCGAGGAGAGASAPPPPPPGGSGTWVRVDNNPCFILGSMNNICTGSCSPIGAIRMGNCQRSNLGGSSSYTCQCR